jgi:hypothetical protein
MSAMIPPLKFKCSLSKYFQNPLEHAGLFES